VSEWTLFTVPKVTEEVKYAAALLGELAANLADKQTFSRGAGLS
jgi:hypothetical protein